MEMSSIEADNTPTGLRNNFEASVSHLLPYDPFQEKYSNCRSGKRDSANISNTTVDRVKVASFGTKNIIGKIRVHLLYHSPYEYKQLKKDEKDELCKWRARTGGGKPASTSKIGTDIKKPNFNNEKKIASAVKKHPDQHMKAMTADKDEKSKDEA